MGIERWEGFEQAVLQAMLLSLRISAVLMVTPLFQAAKIPATAQAVLVAGLSLAVSLNLGSADIGGLSTPVDWVQAASVELTLGITLGLGVSLAMAAFSVAGRMLDVQIGFALAQVFDPGTNRQVSVLDAAFTQIGVLLFLILNGHHALLRAVAFSAERIPVGSTWRVAQSADALFLQAAGLFSLGFALAAPVVFCVLMLEIALGVLARNLPQMNMFVVALPLKIAFGLLALALWFTTIGGAMTRVYASIETAWGQMLRPSPPVLLEGAR